MEKRIQKIIIFLIFVIFAFVINISFMPYFVHFFDNDLIKLNVSMLHTTKLKTKNIIIEGNFLIEYTVTDEKKTGTHDDIQHLFFIPVVPENWNKSQPIKIIAKFRTDDFDRLLEAVETNQTSGVLKNVMCENTVSKDIIKKFLELGLIIDDNCKIIDVRKVNNNNRVIKFLLIFDLLIISLAVVSGIKLFKTKNNGNIPI